MMKSVSLDQLLPPAHIDKPLDVVIDTDTFNEVDDQFAVTYALLSPDRLNVRACYAAPFINERTSCPSEGMQMSKDELIRIYKMLNKPYENCIFSGYPPL